MAIVWWMSGCQSPKTAEVDVDQLDPTDSMLLFTAVPPPERMDILGNGWDIFAEGVIDPGSAGRLEELIREHDIPGRSVLYMNARGGDLAAGLALGRVIRDAGLYTYVGSRDEKGEATWGICTDAGVLAFLGGPFRWIMNGSEVCFSPAMTGMEEGSPTGQLLAAYLVEMEIDTGLLDHLQTAGTEETCMTEADLAGMGINRSGDEAVRWSIEQIEHGEYLKGEINTWRGINKIMFYCLDGRLRLHAIFDPEGRAREILDELNAHTVQLDDQYIPIPPAAIEFKLEMNGLINLSILIDDDLIEPLLQARHVGVMCQESYDSPFFMGIDRINFEGGARLLPGLLSGCVGL